MLLNSLAAQEVEKMPRRCVAAAALAGAGVLLAVLSTPQTVISTDGLESDGKGATTTYETNMMRW